MRHRPLPKYCYENKDRHGNPRIYFWRKGQRRVRIRDIPGTDAFRAAYGDALAKSLDGSLATPAEAGNRIKPHTWRWLCTQYYALGMGQLGPRTRHVRRQILDATCLEHTTPERTKLFADVAVAAMTPKAIRVLRDRKADFPEAANGRLKAIRQVFAWAIKNELATGNPARDVEYLGSSGDGFHTWTIEEIDAYEKRHPIGTKARLALALLLFTGVRRSDVVKLGRQMVRDGWLHFVETKGRDRKTRKPVVKHRQIPVLPELQRVIDATPLGNMTYLVTEYGAPFTAPGFGNWFADRCREAGVPGRAHGLRKAGATIAGDNGATDLQLMAIYGWETTKQAAVYTKKANRKRLAGDAMHLIAAASSEGNSGTESCAPSEGGELSTKISL